MKDAQSTEPECLVLRALIACLSSEDENWSGSRPLDFDQYVPLRNLATSIWDNHRFSMRTQQIGAIARDLGFATKESHGITKIVPTPTAVVRACEECGYDDEAIADLKQQLMKGGAKGDG